MKKIICIIFSAIVMFSAFPICANAETFSDSLDEHISYTFSGKTGELIIQGDGKTADYFNSPFFYLEGNIKTVSIESGIVGIGARLFKNCTSIENIVISDTVSDVDVSAFDGCSGIKEYRVDVENEMYSSFDGVLYSKDLSKLVKYPSAKEDAEFETLKNTVTVCKNSFKGAVNLKTIILSAETTDIRENFEYLDIAVKSSGADEPENPSHNHDSVYKTVFPTCSTYGYIEFSCKSCDVKYINKYICPTGHKLVEQITPATTESDGHIVNVCVVCGEIESDKIINKIEKTALEYTSVIFNKYQHSPNVYIFDSSGNELVSGKDYILSKPLGRKYVGAYSYDVTYISNFSGTARLMLFIYPQSPVFRKIVLGKGETEVCWDKLTAQCDGYEVQYSTNPYFMGDSKTVKINNKNAKSVKLTNLKAKKIYYFRLRSFKNVNDESNVFYSLWSNVGFAKVR